MKKNKFRQFFFAFGVFFQKKINSVKYSLSNPQKLIKIFFKIAIFLHIVQASSYDIKGF
jgi:hypothetical protein